MRALSSGALFAAVLVRLVKMKRSPSIYLICAIITIVLGLFSRSYAGVLPVFLTNYAGDTLWALTAFLGIGILFPKWTTLRVCLTALVFALSIELSQLYHSPWTDHIRHTRIGGLIFGYGFLWSDILCYMVGIAFGWIFEMLGHKLLNGVTVQNG